MAKAQTAGDVATFLGSAKRSFGRFSGNGVSVDLQKYLLSEAGKKAFINVAKSPFERQEAAQQAERKKISRK